MATIPTPDIEVLKNPAKKMRYQIPLSINFPSDFNSTDVESEKVEEEKEEWFESPDNFFYERKYIGF